MTEVIYHTPSSVPSGYVNPPIGPPGFFADSKYSYKGYYEKLPCEDDKWVYVNVQVLEFLQSSTTKSNPQDKACYSHSPPDYPLSQYNKIRQRQFKKELVKNAAKLKGLVYEKRESMMNL